MLWLLADTETTGLDNDPDARMCEVAYCIVDDDLSVVRQGGSVLNPLCHIPAVTSAVHGLTDRDVVNAPSADEYFESEFGSTLLNSEVCLIAHNAKFDAHFLSPHLPFRYHQMCTLRLARVVYPDHSSHKLGALKFELDLAPDEDRFHSADGDLTVLLALVDRMREDTGLSLYGLLNLSCKPREITKMPFGQHKGKDLAELKSKHPGYIQWLMGLKNLDDDLRASIVAL